MDKNLEVKLNKFRKLIFEDLEADLKAERLAVDQDFQKQLAEKRQETEQAAENFYKNRKNVTYGRLNKSLSDAKLDQKKAALELRQDIFQQTLTALEEKAKQFVASDDYYTYLTRELEKLLQEIKAEAVIVYHLPEDKQFLEQLFNQHHLQVEEWQTLASQEIGGLILEVPAQRVRYKVTLSNTIADHQDYIGGVLYELLEEMEG